MIKVPLSHPSIQRTLRPLYANHQATPWTGFLVDTWDRSFPIYPGTVMTRLHDEVFAPYTGQTGATPFGLSALFVAPTLGIDEILDTAQNLFTVWVGGEQALFEVLAPAFDQTANWTLATDGSRQMLTANSEGLLTPVGVNHANVVGELISATPDKITVRLNRLDLASSVTVAGGS